jgi:hypothetical protein
VSKRKNLEDPELNSRTEMHKPWSQYMSFNAYGAG